MPNSHPTTGIPFGYIRADAIDSELFDQLCFSHGKDISYDAALIEHLAQARRLHEGLADEDDPDQDEFDEDEAKQAFADEYQPDEPIYEGEHKGVKYRTSWMGGAPHLWVFESPVITLCMPCSPCVPGAGDLDSVGDYCAYGLPVDWLTKDFIQQQCEEDGYSQTIHQDQPTLKWSWEPQFGEPRDDAKFDSEEASWADCYQKNLQRGL